MTVQEFSNEFDILYNNIMSNQAPGLDEYEKSVFLTQAQEDIVKAYYQGNSAGLGPFENNEAARRSLAGLLETKSYNYSTIAPTKNSREIVFQLDPEVWFIVQEHILDADNNVIDVVPTQYDELSKLRKNPFRGPSKNRVLRLDYKNNSVILFIGDNNISIQDAVYFVTFVKKPYPIILTDLSVSNLSINDENSPLDNTNPCELSSSIHRLILTQAVALAAAAYKS